MFTEFIDLLQNILHLHSVKDIVVLMGDSYTNLPAASFRDQVDKRSIYFQTFFA